ncbi:enoyl-CoA hydratase/isomerase family protein [Maricaulis salignorans]|uniref:Enoyl-CoA hydratase/carnithine racemase n=1 Tax=Maricaulis salignorans TaxID=144026 RepID=A0A1G9TLM4_9PROT|nr:enoyl-CoA hydratase-related protein [Maricaulis salignorans]SDM48709.1 Enoyl-CoA hydratase/carnithine racemase [Maricaulis salignorans]
MTQPPIEGLTLERRGAVAELVLDRPHTRNAFTQAMWAALPGLLDGLAADCRVLIVRGAGNAFASGADISEFAEVYATPERAGTYSRQIAAALDALAAFPHPTIAMIRGACVGGGCALALACDLRFADESARFAITPAKMGLIYPFNDTKRLVDSVGAAMAKDMLFSARTLDAAEALACGLASRVTSPSGLDRLVSEYVDQLLDMSPHSAEFTKQMIARVLAGQNQDSDATKALFAGAFSHADFNEGYRAFLEKRKPDFSAVRAAPGTGTKDQ